MGPRVGMDGCGKLRPYRVSISEPSRPQRVAIPTELYRPALLWCYYSVETNLKIIVFNKELGTPDKSISFSTYRSPGLRQALWSSRDSKICVSSLQQNSSHSLNQQLRVLLSVVRSIHTTICTTVTTGFISGVLLTSTG